MINTTDTHITVTSIKRLAINEKRNTVSPQLIQPVGDVQFSLHEAFLFYGRCLLSAEGVVTKDTKFADFRTPSWFLYLSLRYFW